ncbi:hypothetical protein D1224_13715 [Henriciella barbarensis]|uniref:Uncharacterized protein n=1 Tax=Henriciella barbarensis TaxID=86342 RepID=A0A399QUX9_9PROT|nr:hypothetical protein [Henriciella barbarensis]RIJ21367.1 hypothetical protein D1224_13715 [Henriciella barbarensis]
MISIRHPRRGLLLSLAVLTTSGLPMAAHAQQDRSAPPTTLPFEPTVPSAPPGYKPPAQPRNQPSRAPQTSTRAAPQRTVQAEPAPPPGDPLCYEIGPYIREGVSASRFAGLSQSTAAGFAIGSFPVGDALREIGAGECAVAIPGAAPFSAASPYNQVTCTLLIDQSDEASLEAMRQRRDDLKDRIAACPAVAEWQAELVDTSGERNGALTSDQVFSHPDVRVEMVVRAQQRNKLGQWPDDYIRTLSLILRTPNPDAPPPPEDASSDLDDME